MEKANLCSNMKQRSMKTLHDFKSFCSGSKLGDGDLVAAGLSWPPRSYLCSFCKRKFRSAQALGGHMNVHRRDRARLRQSPPSPTDHGQSSNSNSNGNNNAGQFSMLNLNLGTNPSFYTSPSFLPPSPLLTSKLPPLSQAKRLSEGEIDLINIKNPEFVRLDLEIGLISPSKEELDLELRLGYT